MNQETRNKKNAKYKQNLNKRYGITKSSDWKKFSDNGIELSDEIVPTKHEFVLTKRHGQTVSKEVYTYEWSKVAKNSRKEYHDTKNGIMPAAKKPKEIKPELSKEEKLKSRQYSAVHHMLVNSLYGGTTKERIERQVMQQQAHEGKIKKIIENMKERSLLKQQRYMEQKPYKVVIATNNDPQYKVIPLSMKEKEISELANHLNKKMSAESADYKSINVFARNIEDPIMIFNRTAA